MKNLPQATVAAAVAQACQKLFGLEAVVVLTRPDPQFGDFASNIALQLSKSVGKNPREVAEAIAAELRTDLDDTLSDVAIAGPGFINLRLRDYVLAGLSTQGPAQVYAGKTILAEYSDPNPFKPMHAGHLYTTLVGDTIARLTEAAGAKTVRLNFGGDVGLHVGKSMWSILRHLGGEHPEALESVDQAERAAWLGARYVEGNNAYEDDEAAKAEIIAVNKRVYALHEADDHESSFARIYWTCRQWSYDYFSMLYEQLQVVPFDRFIPESEVTPLGIATVREQLEKGVFQTSDGAVVFNGESRGLHTRVFINSEGIPTYEAKDVGLSLTKWRDYHFDQSIIITANEQLQYMQVVLAAIHEFALEASERTSHLVHGFVKLQGGVKMSSRKGNVVTALEILDSARQAGAMTGTDPSEDTILAAVKYSFAKNRIGSDIVYDPKESIALEGNSGPYLQYAHARARSIMAKAGKGPTNVELIDLEADEHGLLLKITGYAEAVDRAVAELMPHHICSYLYELAQEFNRFYEKNQVVGDPRQAVRLELVRLYADRLKAGLGLLGIAAPDRM
jgi:arginyl-tRNA synthetase